ncbi:MAG: MATE family efflux transporter [Steroidobacteraceae bacterium]
MKKYGRFAPPPSGVNNQFARRVDGAGRIHVDQRTVLTLALPLMANIAVQVVLGLTNMWFIGRISTKALAAVGAVQWLVLAVVLVLSGAGSAVQTIVAQSHGARHPRRAAQATWTALWATLCVFPVFVSIAAASHLILAPFGFDPQVESLAAQFWFPRVAGAGFGAALGALFGFFNGIGQPRMTLLVTLITAVANVVFNQLLVFRLGFGIAGSGWATTAAQALGLLLALGMFLSKPYRCDYKSHLTWRPKGGRLLRQLKLGFPMGLLPAADLLGYSIFQMMQVRLGTAGGAATQMVTILTSITYVPGFGLASAATTLVGQSIGAGDREWAMRVGTHVIVLTTLCTGGLGVLLAAAGPWLLPVFAGTHDADAAPAVLLGVKLLWLAAAYQLFDGVNLGSTMCLRGAGDATVPVAMLLPISWLVFVPLAHSLTFAPGQGWVHFLPQFGWGTIGGWIAVVLYLMVIGTVLFVRWRSGAWQKIRI